MFYFKIKSLATSLRLLLKMRRISNVAINAMEMNRTIFMVIGLRKQSLQNMVYSVIAQPSLMI